MIFNSIRFKVIALITVGAVIGSLLIEFAWAPRMNALLIDTQSREVRREVEILSDGILPYLLSNQIGAVYETLDSVKDRYDNWVEVILYREDGRRIYPLGPAQSASGPAIITESVQIEFEDRSLGLLMVIVDTGPEIQRFRSEQLRMVYIAAGIVALILLGVAYTIDRLFTRRLIQVARAADEMAVGNYDVSLPEGRDEVGVLARSFSSMRAQIQYQTTSLKDARARAEHALEARSRFIATMSHEIRTPLNGIIPVAELLSTSELDPAQQDKVQTIVQSGKALSSIVDDILDMSMLETGKLTLRKDTFSPVTLCDEASAVVRPSAERKGLLFESKYDGPDNMTCLGDMDRLRQVLINILGNAVKFTEVGRVSLRTKIEKTGQDRCRLTFVIADTGIGISEKAMGRIFDRFEQEDQGTARRFGGSGLGLSIVKTLVEAMNGTIGVKSTQGVGSEFTVEIELETTGTQAASTGAKSSVAETIGDNRTALVVDDSEINRTVATAMLESLGFRVDAADNGLSALFKAQQKKFDVIFMDMHMPEMDGLVATRRIREEQGPNTSTRIIALTASVQQEDIEKCRAAGMDAFMPKPLKTDRMKAVLAE
jgi:signal transduction histidine kinase